MSDRKGVIRWAACALLACGGAAYAAEASPSPDQVSADLALQQPVYMQASTPPAPLMGLLDQAGVGKTLEEWGINIHGYVEGSYEQSIAYVAQHRILVGRGFDFRDQNADTNQLDLQIERDIDASKGKFDIGFKVELIGGQDAAFIHSNGLTDVPFAPEEPWNQFDINQLYLTMAVPVGNGLTVEAGKFDAMVGYEGINPTGNSLYTHSYMFYIVPYTQTGVTATYPINDQFTVMGGITRGWGQTLKDNNGCPDAVGNVTWTPDKKTSVTLGMTEGPEMFKDNSDYDTLVDLVAHRQISDELSVGLGGDFVNAPHVAPGVSANFYGLAGYASYVLSPMFTLNGRVEVLRDEEGAFLGSGGGLNACEATAGVSIKPFPNDPIGQNLVVRPELRVDYASKPVFDGSNADYYQVTAAVDAYFTF